MSNPNFKGARHFLDIMARLCFATFLAEIGGCSVSPQRPVVEKQIVEQGRIDAEEFRRLFPLDVQRTKSILEDYTHVQRRLIAAGKTGVEVAVTILGADGTIHAGEDTAYYEDVPRLREVRDNYTAIQVGKSLCIRHPGEKYSCKQSSLPQQGLPDAPLEHVARIWSRDLTCYGEVACRFIKIQLGSAESDVDSMEGFSKDPELVGHDYELAFRLTDYLPVYFRQTDRYHVGIVAAAIYHGFRFDQPIDAVELPASGEMTQSEAIPPLVAQTDQLSKEPFCTLPAYLVRRRVQYPLEAIMQRQSGKTVIQLIVQVDGTPMDLSILSSSGFNLLDDAALAAVKEYRFTPKKCNGKAVTSPALVPVLFDVKPIDPGAIKFAQDDTPLEREDVDQEIAFLNAQQDIQKVGSEEGDIYFDQANYSVWLIRRDADSNQRILVRIRAEYGRDVLYQNYATLCDGNSDWCSAQLEFCLDLVQQSPIPAIEQKLSE